MSEVHLIHPIALLAAPRLGAPVVALLADPATIEIIESSGGFLHARCGAIDGYLPAALCAGDALHAADMLRTMNVFQPVVLYAKPAPGQQFTPDAGNSALQWMIQPDEVLGLLGQSDRFVLVQRPGGQIGYIPAELVRDGLSAVPHSKPKQIDFFWILLGFGGALLNWSSMSSLMFALLVPETLRPYSALALLIGAASALWFSPRRLQARSLAGGALLCYIAMHLLSQGRLTFWQI